MKTDYEILQKTIDETLRDAVYTKGLMAEGDPRYFRDILYRHLKIAHVLEAALLTLPTPTPADSLPNVCALLQPETDGPPDDLAVLLDQISLRHKERQQRVELLGRIRSMLGATVPDGCLYSDKSGDLFVRCYDHVNGHRSVLGLPVDSETDGWALYYAAICDICGERVDERVIASFLQAREAVAAADRLPTHHHDFDLFAAATVAALRGDDDRGDDDT